MAMAIRNWATQTVNTYLRNATSQRDFRVQLRGNRSAILFSVYLALLIFFSMYVYSSSNRGGVSIVDAQNSLRGFYTAVIGMLAGAVTLVAPGMGSMAIVMEKQRRSLDLVFSAPVTVRYYLIGKLISVYRYIWLLLILALPVTAACVMLGGATWSGVLEVYLGISMYGLIQAAFALLNSCYVNKPIPALIWSYLFTGGYLILTGALSAAGYGMRFSRGPGVGAFNEVNCFLTLSPFTLNELSGSYTTIAGHQIPNWILGVLISLLIVRVVIIGAGAVLAPASTGEIRSLRIMSLFYAAGITGLIAYFSAPSIKTVTSMAAPKGSSGVGVTIPTGYLEGMTLGNTMLLVGWMLVPIIACFGFDELRRFRPNGWFNIREVFAGTPSGALPYMATLLVAAFGGVAAGSAIGGGEAWKGGALWGFFALVAATWFLLWSVARLSCAALKGVKVGRNIVAVFFLLFLAAPPAILSGFASDLWSAEKIGVWDLYPFRSLVSSPDHVHLSWIHAVWMTIAAIFIFRYSEKILRTSMQHKGLQVYGIQTSA